MTMRSSESEDRMWFGMGYIPRSHHKSRSLIFYGSFWLGLSLLEILALFKVGGIWIYPVMDYFFAAALLSIGLDLFVRGAILYAKVS